MLLAGSVTLLAACTTPSVQQLPAEEVFSLTPEPGTLYIFPSVSLGEISPFVFGTNYGPWNIVPLDLMPLAEQAGIRFLRFPGGNWGDQNDLTSLQIDTYIDLTKKLGAEPSISARLLGGSPEAAAELVRYINIEKGYDVRYWSIGNEPQYYDDYDTARFNQEWRQIALAMQEVDPAILLIGPEITQYLGDPSLDPRDANGKLWMDEFLKANGDLVDVVSIHRYPFPTSLNSGPAQINDLRTNVKEWDGIIPSLRNLIRETTGKELPIAITEINSHWNAMTGGEATPDSNYNAIWLADVLGRMISQQVQIVAQFAIQSSSDNGGWGLFSRVEPRPSYYVYRMYQLFGDQLIASVSALPEVSIYAAAREDGKLTVMVINLKSEQVQAQFSLNGINRAMAEVWLFDADHPAQQIDSVQLNDGGLVTLPPQSISLFIFSK